MLNLFRFHNFASRRNYTFFSCILKICNKILIKARKNDMITIFFSLKVLSSIYRSLLTEQLASPRQFSKGCFSTGSHKMVITSYILDLIRVCIFLVLPKRPRFPLPIVSMGIDLKSSIILWSISQCHLVFNDSCIVKIKILKLYLNKPFRHINTVSVTWSSQVSSRSNSNLFDQSIEGN